MDQQLVTVVRVLLECNVILGILYRHTVLEVIEIIIISNNINIITIQYEYYYNAI